MEVATIPLNNSICKPFINLSMETYFFFIFFWSNTSFTSIDAIKDFAKTYCVGKKENYKNIRVVSILCCHCRVIVQRL